MKKIIIALLIPVLTSCFKYTDSSTERDKILTKEYSKIEYIISKYNTAKENGVNAFVVKREKDSNNENKFLDYNNQILDCLSSIEYKESDNHYLPTFTILDFESSIMLDESMEFISTCSNVNYSSYIRVYDISVNDGKKLMEIAKQTYNDYSSYIDKCCTSESLNLYLNSKKSEDTLYLVKSDMFTHGMTTKVDNNHTIINKLKETDHTPIVNPYSEMDYCLLFDLMRPVDTTYHQIYVQRKTSGWEYFLLEDYQTVRLVFSFAIDNRQGKKSIYYHIDLEDGEWIYSLAKFSNSDLFIDNIP